MQVVRTITILVFLSKMWLGSGPASAEPAFAPGSPWQVIVRGEQSEAEKLATIDLQRYLAEASGSVPKLMTAAEWGKSPVPAVVVGTPDAGPAEDTLLHDLDISKATLGEQGYFLAEKTVRGTRVVIAAGATPIGAVNAVYGLLRELGFGFYLGSEAIPERLPADLASARIVRKPVLSIRGVLPWYNFFNSPTVWDPIDHRAFVDQLIRMGANFVGFHTYDTEPFAACEDDGEMKWGQRLLNTASPTWGTHPMPAREFAFGTHLLFADDFFGAASTQWRGHRDEAIRREQAILRDALDYAKRRGLHPCIGFELSGDPTNPADREVFLKRLNHVLHQYPAVDYIWLWQMETQGVQGYRSDYAQHILPGGPAPESPLHAYAASRREAFRRVVERTAGERPFLDESEGGKHARALEGARLEQFAQLACRTLERRVNPPKLVMCGWGGDERLLSAEYYQGLDRLLPSEVVFASLDHIIPRPRVDAIYHELPPQRQRWPIPWLEYDGDLWHPQPFVHIYEAMMRDIGRGGSQGALGIHWRTRDLEENFAYLVEYAWNPELTAASFFRELARRCYPETIAEDMARIHLALDRLGYRWVGGGGQAECAPFWWGPGEDRKAAELSGLRSQIAELLERAGKSRPRLQWLLDCIDWVLHFRQAELAALRARDLLARAASADADQTKVLAGDALAALDAGPMADALRAYARRVSTRGEQGVLATINTKAVVAWRNLRSDALRLLERPAEPEPSIAWNPEPSILLPRFIGSTAQGQPLELMPVVLGGGQAYAHYRKMGESAWTTVPLKTVRTSASSVETWVQRVEIPADHVVPPGLQVGFSWTDDPSASPSFGPLGVTVLPEPVADGTPQPRQPIDLPGRLVVTSREADATAVEITWTDIRQADYFKVYRDDRLVCETAVAMFPDTPMAPFATYRVEAWRGGKVLTTSEPYLCEVPDRLITGGADLHLQVNRAGIILRWSEVTGGGLVSRPPSGVQDARPPTDVCGYQLERQPAASEEISPPEVLSRMWLAAGNVRTHRDVPPAGRWIYTLKAINAAGRAFTVASSQPVAFAPSPAPAPGIDWPLTALPEGAGVSGNVSFEPSGARFGGGYLTFPHVPGLDLGQAMTLSFEFKADKTCLEAMPVLLCHGLWQEDGWFVQILNGSLIVRTAAGDATGPRIAPDQWYKIRFVFDGLSYHLSVDGQWLPQHGRPMTPRPATRRLVIGQYETPSHPHTFLGMMRDVRLYSDAILE